MIVLLLILGVIVGLCSALLGLGGNIFIIPLLPYLGPFNLKEVIATGVCTVALVTGTNALVYYRKKLIDFKLAWSLLFLVALGSYIGAWSMTVVSIKFVKILLVFVLIIMVSRLLFFKDSLIFLNGYWRKWVILISGSISGIFAGLTGIGTGVILGPVMIMFSLTDYKKIGPTLNLLTCIACFIASWAHLRSGVLNYPWWGRIHLESVILMFLGAQFGAIIGREYNNRISEGLRKRVVGIILIFILIKLIFIF